MESKWVELDGPVHYADFGGGGPLLVLVHGLGGSHTNWAAAAPLLARRARVLALDLAGFGRTPLAGRSAGVHANQRLLDRFVAEVCGGPVILVGNSMGGMISLRQAAANPGRTAGLVLVDPSVPRARGTRMDPLVRAAFTAYALPGVGERLLRERRTHLSAERLVAETLALCCADPSLVPAEVVAASVALTRERNHPEVDRAFLEAARSLLWVLARPHAYHRMVRSVLAPTLLLHGDRDRLVLLASARRIAALRPDWTFTVLDGVGHVPQLEAAGRFAAAVAAWLDGPGRAAAERATPERATPQIGNELATDER